MAITVEVKMTIQGMGSIETEKEIRRIAKFKHGEIRGSNGGWHGKIIYKL